ncbi:unnamed protein product [Prorocentrum cordatum]|uniref:Alpha/beta hydrolase fold-3 domain-containing protein n=1 Tax=Prorocentrum cordatum TaxID=2364126 RepID=A0ABN9UMB7_9DINO|nr:unnamed protein product [Polarella glacialis]
MALDRHKPYDRLHSLKQPALIITGTPDFITPARCSYDMAAQLGGSILKMWSICRKGGPEWGTLTARSGEVEFFDDVGGSHYYIFEVAFRVRSSDGEKAAELGEDPGGLGGGEVRREAAAADEERDRRKEQDARQYLEKHGLTNFMQFLMQSLMKDKPANPYSFLQKQVTKRMVSEVSRTIAGDRIDLLVEDKGLDTLLEKFSSGEVPLEVTPEQLAQLERDAAAAGEQLRADNARLRETAARLKEKYGQLVEETTNLQKQVLPDTQFPMMPAPQPGESQQLAAYREIAHMQVFRPDVKHPEHLLECERAVGWSMEHAAEFHGDRDKLVLCGESAGGQLAALLTMRLRASGKVRAAWLISPPIDYREKNIARLHPLARYMVRLLLVRPAFGNDEAVISSASPMSGFESGHWGRIPVLLTGASSEFVLPWLNRQADIISDP